MCRRTRRTRVGGIYFRGRLLRGPWKDVADAPAHIDAKELMVLVISLRAFLPPSVGARALLWWADSSTPLRQQGRWHSISPSSSSGQGCASPRPFPSHPHSPRLHPRGGESPGGRGVSVSRSAGLASPSGGVRSHLSLLRSLGHRSLRVNSVCSSSSRGATLGKQKPSTLRLRGGSSTWLTPFLLLLFFLASLGSWRRRRASSSLSRLIGPLRSGLRPFFVSTSSWCGACWTVRQWWIFPPAFLCFLASLFSSGRFSAAPRPLRLRRRLQPHRR